MKDGLTLMEEAFCQLVALGKTASDAWCEAFGKTMDTLKDKRKAQNAASYLQKRPDIAARILEAAGEQRRRDRQMWEERGSDLAERIYKRVVEADRDGKLLSQQALKGVEVLAKLKGLNAPDETVLKDGGRADDYHAPRALEAMSEEDLMKIAQSDTIEAEVVEDGGKE